ncbi:MAG TPA: DUF4430 domain-containing protein [Patescibacteria group bacterium]|nr:DUF4430 domain-containing protein [Patescibacteria group bacterium]
MKKIKIPKPTLYLSGLLVAILLGSGLFFKSILLPVASETAEKQPEVLGQAITIPPSPSPSPIPSLKPSLKPAVKASVKPSIKPSPPPTPPGSTAPAPSTASSPAVLGATSASPSPGTSPSHSPPPAGGSGPSPSPSASISPQTVNLEIQGSGFTIEISGNLNVCQVLEKAKDQGKISSLTLDDSYMSSMNSQYVREINGMSNNWTFKVNGNSPLGCSLYTVKPGDQIVFKFG